MSDPNGWPDASKPGVPLNPARDEEWRPVVGYEGFYEVSSFGRVRTLGGGKARTHGRILKATVGTTGYLRVALSAGNVSRTCKVHRLVAAAFHGGIPPRAYVLHRDGDPTNNAADNLYFGDARQNLKDAICHGVWKPARGEAAGKAKLNTAAVQAIRASAGTHAALARLYGVDAKTIRSIRTNRSWAHV
jgi:hypothetical protein